MRRTLLWYTALAACVAAVTACGISDPDSRGVAYALVSIDGQSLPAPLPGNPGAEVVEGGFRNHRSDIVEWLSVRCIIPAPSGSTCQHDGVARIERRGVYNALEWRLYVDDGVYFPMEFSGETEAIIRFGQDYEHEYRYTR